MLRMSVLLSLFFIYVLLLKEGMPDVDKMTGKQFEEFLSALLEKMRYKVHLTNYSGNFGADLLFEMDYKRVVVKAKNKGNVPVKASVASKAHYQADESRSKKEN